MPGRLVFSTTASGASSPTEQLRITSNRYVRLASGTGGIQFGGDTAAANALDDYEEGTFTPVLTGSASGTLNISGRYTKIGDLVTIFIQSNAITTANKPIGNYTVTGLPFVARATTPDSTSLLFSNFARVTFDSAKSAAATVNQGTSTISLLEQVSNDLSTSFTDANFVSVLNMFFRITGSYLV